MEISRIDNLYQFLKALIELLDLVRRSKEVLFRRTFRSNVDNSLEMVVEDLHALQNELQGYEQSEDLRKAGLDQGNPQLMLKLESFSQSLVELEENGGEENLEDALEKGSIILGSLVGALPVIGSAAKELLDFLTKELKKRRYRWIFR